MTISLENRLGSRGFLFLGPSLAPATHDGVEAYQADACPGQGGAFNDETPECSTSQSFPTTPDLSRHKRKGVRTGPVASGGLVLMWPAIRPLIACVLPQLLCRHRFLNLQRFP